MVSLFDQGPPPPCPTPFNMAAYAVAGNGAPEAKVAIEVLGQDISLTYGALRTLIARLAGAFRSYGLAPGDRLLFRLGNCIEFPLAYLAAIWAGIIPVPTSAQLTAGEARYLSDQCEARAILWQDGVSLPEGSILPVIARQDLSALSASNAIPPVMGDPNRLAYIIFTSGTSGQPRGVCHAHRAIWARRMMYRGWYDLGAEDRLLHAGAFNWTYTLGTGVMDPWAMGATALIPGEGTRPAQLGDLLCAHRASIFAAAPGVYRQILKHDLPKLDHLRHGLSAGEHLSERIRTTWHTRTGTQLHQALGMSECSTFISSSPHTPAPPDRSGKPQQGRKVAILKDGAPVPFGTEGTLAIGREDPGLMLGYLNEPQISGPWFVTGDMARMAPDGTIHYLGRADDMMNAGGFRVSPLEVEAHFAKLTRACAAVEVQVKRDTTVIALFHQGSDEQTLRAHAELGLARYKQPRLYIPVTELPYGGNGKLNRRALRDSYKAP